MLEKCTSEVSQGDVERVHGEHAYGLTYTSHIYKEDMSQFEGYQHQISSTPIAHQQGLKGFYYLSFRLQSKNNQGSNDVFLQGVYACVFPLPTQIHVQMHVILTCCQADE